MPRLSVCVETFWGKDLKPHEKMAKCADLGYQTVEFWGWSNKDIAAIKQTIEAKGLRIAVFGGIGGGPLVAPGATASLLQGLRETAEVAAQLGVDRLLITTGNERKAERFEVTRRTVVRNLKAMCPVLEEKGLTLVVEPLNPIVNHLGYWLTTMPDAADICYDVDHPNVKILMDIYHQQITEGNIIDTIRQYAPLIGHFHCAGVPGRHELVGGELDYGAIFKVIDEVGYDGYVGLEFHPAGDTEAALRQALELAG
ncbi:MAG: TIM barrel protein [Kiritimatiellae bacterium]|nr:TIM barrel protein [Kiritimatiellia bacterium]